MALLFDLGWRQGSLLQHKLPFVVVRLGETGGVAQEESDHGLWMVVTQDCDLAYADATAHEPLIELRPVREDTKLRPSGIRSRDLVLIDGQQLFLSAQSPRVMAEPRALNSISHAHVRALTNPLADHELTRLKLWLGRRYDRPAVPEEFVPLAQQIATAVEYKRKSEIVPLLRDVLWSYEEGRPPRFSLYAVLADGADREQAREWLAGVGLEVPDNVGIPDEIEVGTADAISLRLLENSFSADVSSLTWRGGPPTGAY